MSILQSILYGFVSGATELLPVSAQAHQGMMLRLFGMNTVQPLRDLLVHISILLALWFSCQSIFHRYIRENRVRSSARRTYTTRGQYDLRIVKTAAVPLIIGQIVYFATARMEFSCAWIALFLLINGAVLILPEYMSHGNKDAATMSGLDGVLMGVCGALSSFPGISRSGAISSYCVARGASRQNAFNWIMVLSVPALVLMCFLDLINIFTIGVSIASFVDFLGYLISAMSAFGGAYLGYLLFRFLTSQSNYSVFAYYSWGAALLSFTLYLIV